MLRNISLLNLFILETTKSMAYSMEKTWLLLITGRDENGLEGIQWEGHEQLHSRPYISVRQIGQNKIFPL